MGASQIGAALVDVGGTLWPNSFPIRQNDGEGRVARVQAVLPDLSAEGTAMLVHELFTQSRDLNGGTTMVTELIRVDADTVVANCLAHQGIPATPSNVVLIRRAMALPIDDRIRPLPGALELLAAIRSLGLRCVIASNTYWRDADGYWEDFHALGMGQYIDAVVTSVDAGHLKPHPAVFELAVQAAGVPAEQCVVIGNKEVNDIEPALALGMRAILVYPDDPAPTASRAHAVAPDLWACASSLRVMLGR